LSMQNRFNSKHSLALYELCVDYFIQKQGKGETPWITIDDFKKLMSVQNEKHYLIFKNMNRYVLKESVNEINEKSDLFVKVEYKKQVRKVIAIKFKIAPNPNKNNILSKLKIIDIEPQNEANNSANNLSTIEKEQKIKNEELYIRLIEHYCLNDKQTQEVMQTKDEEYITDVLNYVEEKRKNGKIKENIGSFTYSALRDDYRPKKSLFEVEEEKNLLKKKEAELKLKQHKAILEQLSKDHSVLLANKAEEYLENLPEKEKNQLIKRFKGEKLNDFSRNYLQKNGLESPMMKSSFLSFITQEVLSEKLPNFEVFAEENGHLVEKDQSGNWSLKD
jgi:hypothetical protein